MRHEQKPLSLSVMSIVSHQYHVLPLPQSSICHDDCLSVHRAELTQSLTLDLFGTKVGIVALLMETTIDKAKNPKITRPAPSPRHVHPFFLLLCLLRLNDTGARAFLIIHIF
jgi:hypothetical protein